MYVHTANVSYLLKALGPTDKLIKLFSRNCVEISSLSCNYGVFRLVHDACKHYQHPETLITFFYETPQVHVAARSKACTAAARLLRLWVRIPPVACLPVVTVVCCHVEVSTTSWSLVQRSPTDCAASLCDLETSSTSRPWPTGGCCAKRKRWHGMKCGRSINELFGENLLLSHSGLTLNPLAPTTVGARINL